MVRAAEEVMSGWVAFGWVVAIAAGGGLVVLGLIWPLVRGEQSRDAQLVQQLRADLLPEAARTGWVESEPAPELTRWGLGTVVPDEKRCCLLASQQAGHQAALIWCVHDDNDGTLRYTVLLVGPAVPVPAMEIRRRFKIFSLLRPGPTGQETDEDARFAQTFKIVSHADPTLSVGCRPARCVAPCIDCTSWAGWTMSRSGWTAGRCASSCTAGHGYRRSAND